MDSFIPWLIPLLCILSFATDVDSLYCFRCLSVDCPDDSTECNSIRSFIQSELRNLYYFDDYLVPCPKLNETHDWRKMQLNDDPCPEEKPNEATCTVGRMQIKSIEIDASGKKKTRTNHATVLGCAKRQLLTRIKNAFNEGRCDLDQRIRPTFSSTGVSLDLQIEHCRDPAWQCYNDDYCLDWKQSEVKTWDREDKKFEFTLVIGILALVVIGMSACLIAGLCRDPPNISSSLPKSIGDESESVKVLDFRDKAFSSIEVDESNVISSSSSRRPSIPPPPPPRLHKPLRRESTPV